MDAEEEIESRKKLDEQKRSCRRSCEKLKNSRVGRKRFRKDSRVTILQRQLQEVEQRRHDLMPEHQKVQKISKDTKLSG